MPVQVTICLVTMSYGAKCEAPAMCAVLCGCMQHVRLKELLGIGELSKKLGFTIPPGVVSWSSTVYAG